jgi:hypothetical protein
VAGEARIESYLLDLVRQAGGECIKVGHGGWPDRFVLLPGGVLATAELKNTGEVPRALQLARLERLAELGFKVAAPDSREAVRQFMRGLGC